MKPTAQELWERIVKSLWSLQDTGVLLPRDNKDLKDSLQLIQDYAQAYHEEQIEKNTIMIGEPYKKP